MNIRHDQAGSCFELVGADAEKARCEYRRKGDIWILSHTYVPEAMRGSGVAAALVRAALDHIRAEGGRVVPDCSFVAAYIQRNPEYAGLVEARR